MTRALAVGLLSGCGLVLDLDPPDPEGMDASVIEEDAGAAVDAGHEECDPDACDDGVFCNGVETCSDTGCIGGEPPSCDDAIACTIDTCDEAQHACTHAPDDTACPSAGECLVGVCMPGVGCELEASDDACPDDMIACTVDFCEPVDGTCEHVADSTLCAANQICGTDGCRTVTCTDGTTCPERPCQFATCVGGTCRYTADVDQSGERCGNPPPCVDSFCDATGNCVASAAIVCQPSNDCTTATCGRDAEGGATCEQRPRPPGDPCDDGDPCTGPGSCSGSVCNPGASLCLPSHMCENASCSATGACMRSPISCGTNATCDPARGCGCDAGFDDCDMNGACECPRLSGGGTACSGSRCTSADAGTGPDGGGLDAGMVFCAAGLTSCGGRTCCLTTSYCSIARSCNPCPQTCTGTAPFCCPCMGRCVARSADCTCASP